MISILLFSGLSLNLLSLSSGHEEKSLPDGHFSLHSTLRDEIIDFVFSQQTENREQSDV